MITNSEMTKQIYKFLSLLMENANIPYTDIAKKVNVSPGTVHVRMKKNGAAWYGKRLAAQCGLCKAGFDITAFLASTWKEVHSMMKRPKYCSRSLKS